LAKRIIIVGAVALGPKVACRLRRLDPDAEIIMVDRDNIFSYGGCGIPYYVSGDVPDLEELYSTSSHVIRDTDFFRTSKRVSIMSRVEAVSMDRRKKKLLVRHQDEGKQESLDYDKLVIATGVTPIKPPIPGVDLPMDFAWAFKEDRIKVMDVRDPKEAEPFIEKYGARWMNIPQNELRDRLDEVPADEPLCLVCGTGARSYECQILLNQKGFTNIRNVQGGHAMLMATNPDFI
jgi:NADPH-dependent 2,4-dienoyl-CoA reductase/sulfur reductase-like enzyme